jgi:probable DNA repair protein
MSRDALFAAMEQGALVVTGNVRLSQSLLKDYEREMVERGLQAWVTPDVLPWRAWLLRTWEEAVIAARSQFPMRLLNSNQELQLWESIIEEHSHGLLRMQATAIQVREAWQLLRSWCIEPDAATFGHNDDTQAFHTWMRLFDEKCRDHNWLPEGTIPTELIRLFNEDGYSISNGLILAGFDEFVPSQQYLLQILDKAGVPIRWIRPEGKQARVVRVTCNDMRHEAEAVGRWVRQRLADNPQARVGIVVPDLSAQRTSLEHALRQTLMPQTLLPGADAAAKNWNISLGLPLNRYPIIQAALLSLTLIEGRATIEMLGEMLRSPYLAGCEQEVTQRALLDRKLRDLAEPVIPLSRLCYYAGQVNQEDGCPRPWTSPELAKRLNGLRELLKERPMRADAGVWVAWFTVWLNMTGWPSGRSLASDEYQMTEAWKKLLAAFGSLETVTGPFSYRQALATLERMAATQIFQPESGESPVHVLGLYEAIGQEFDYLWVMGLRDDVWPPAPRPNPFIPLALQRKHGLPHVDIAREWEVAKGVMDRLMMSATDVVLSYPARNGDVRYRPSPLMLEVAEVAGESLGLWQGSRWQDAIRSSAQLETILNDDAPPLEQTRASGGSAVFKHQSICPFRAFAEHRLGAKPLRQAQIGLDAMKRGTLLHRVLELFWTRVVSHEQLLVMDAGLLEQAVTEVVEAALAEEARSNPLALSERFKAVESQRLLELALKWLAIEKQRAPFRVMGLEKEVNAEINGVGVHLWIDRIDELPDGRKVIVDYKSGKVTPSHWFGERPDDPQLPLYSAIEGGEIAAVLFAQIKAGDLGFKGVVQDENLIPGLPPSKGRTQLKEIMSQWPAVLTDWQKTIAQLAADFKAGHAAVDPKRGVTTCDASYCELMPLCRIHEQKELGGTYQLEAEADE